MHPPCIVSIIFSFFFLLQRSATVKRVIALFPYRANWWWRASAVWRRVSRWSSPIRSPPRAWSPCGWPDQVGDPAQAARGDQKGRSHSRNANQRETGEYGRQCRTWWRIHIIPSKNARGLLVTAELWFCTLHVRLSGRLHNVVYECSFLY